MRDCGLVLYRGCCGVWEKAEMETEDRGGSETDRQTNRQSNRPSYPRLDRRVPASHRLAVR